MQSPHDLDATYREKESGDKKQKVKGYSVNITENCVPNELKLIMGVQVENASFADCNYFKEAIEQVIEVAGSIPAEIATDGAYNSQDNINFLETLKFATAWYLSAIQGRSGKFKFAWNEMNELIVTEIETGKVHTAQVITPRKTSKNQKLRYRIITTDGKYRYFDELAISSYFRREDIKELPKEIRNIRPNVEATIRQVFCTLNGSKSKYRGLVQHRHFVLCRCLWVNARRITAKVQGKGFWKTFFAFLEYYYAIYPICCKNINY